MTLLDDRLRTRFEWGLLVDVAPPDFETRLAIIKNKAALLGMELPDKISAYIAENVTANVRQLEGTINKIMAYKDLLGNDTDEETVTRAIQDMLRRNNEYIPSPSDLEYISKFYSLDEAVIRASSASGTRCRPGRSPCTSPNSTPSTAHDHRAAIGGRNHATVLHSCKAVSNLIETDKAFRRQVEEIEKKVLAQ